MLHIENGRDRPFGRHRARYALAIPVGIALLTSGVTNRAAAETAVSYDMTQTVQPIPSANYNSPTPGGASPAIRGLDSSSAVIVQVNDGLEPAAGVSADPVYHARPATAASGFNAPERTPPMTVAMGGSGMDMNNMDHMDMSHMDHMSMHNMNHGAAPAGVYGAGMVGAGHFMFSYTPMYMHMSGNYIGDSTVSPDTIATTARLPTPMRMMGMTFNTYRIVPTSMDMQMHMLHAMYGVTDWLNLMVMGSYNIKSMTMRTYSGATGTTVLGSTTNHSEGFGDTSVMSLWRIYQDPINHIHINAGLSLPTGGTTGTMTMLAPMNMIMTMRSAYGMQLGTGTVDFLPGVTYTGHISQWSWGAIYRGRLALGDTSEGYRYGYRQNISGWGGYSWAPGVTTTFRVDGEIDDHIHGSDPSIASLMQGSNPYFYGGKRIDLLGGLTISGMPFGLGNTQIAIEGGAPVYQALNGPQLGEAWRISGALRVGF